MARLTFSADQQALGALPRDLERPVAHAATLAINDAANAAKAAGRASIASAGFPSNWQNALQSRTYPTGSASINAAAVIFDKIRYAGIFETGGQIRGDLLWVPLPAARGVRVGRQRQRMFTIKRAGKPPLLATKIGGRGSRQTVPLYVGVPLVNIEKKFDIATAVDRARAGLGGFFQARLREEG